MSVLIDWALQPLGMVTLALLFTLLVWCITGAKPLLPFLCFCASTTLLLVFSMPSVANALVYRLENARENPAYCSSEEAHHMVVLGGGIDLYVNTDSPYEILKPDSLIRILRAPEFASPNTQYYLLGGGAGERTLATNMKAVLLDLNIDASAIIVESKSKSTHENAQALRTILPPDQNQTIFLVTSALHVNRAAATFEKVGYQVCHLGLDTQYSIPKLPVSLLPYLSGLNKTTLALHESIASIVYQIKGHL